MAQSIVSTFVARGVSFSATGLALLLAGTVATFSRAADAPNASPAAAVDLLAQKGLSKLKATPTSIPWVLADDAKVHDELEAFRKAEATHRTAAKKVKDEAAKAAKDHETLTKAEKRYQELKAYLDKPETIPRKLAARYRSSEELGRALLDELNSQAATINHLRPEVNGGFSGGMAPKLKMAITEWMIARNKLIIAYLAAEPDFTALDKRYKGLAEDAEVAAALKSLGPKHRLGSPGFEQDKKNMTAAESTAMSDEIPFIRDRQFDSLGGLLNETVPVAVQIESVSPNAGNWMPVDLLVKAGIAIDPTAPPVTLTLSANGKKSVYQCRQVAVPKLRFGKHVLENLQFLALPDEAKDLGPQLMSKELAGFDLTPDVEKWLFKMVKKE
jgi:hypothetical protein